MADTLCGLCLKKGKANKMLYSSKNKRYICPVCKTITMPMRQDDDYVDKEVTDEITELMQGMYKANLPAKAPIPAGEALKGVSGSKCKGGSKKADLKKKSLSQINAGLAGKNILFES